MAVTALTPVQLTRNTMSSTIVIASQAVVATSQTDGWTVPLGTRGKTSGLFLVFIDDGSGTNTVTIKAGDRPLANGRGDLVFNITASEVNYLFLDDGRFEQSDSGAAFIQIVGSDAGAKCAAFLMPVANEGGSAIA